MNQQNYDYLENKYPELFERARSGYFSINDGWVGILDTLFELLTRDLNQARRDLEWRKERDREGKPVFANSRSLEELEQRVQEELDLIPVIAQIKEKFGGLRLYIDVKKDGQEEYIRFAESMSYHVCETCGAPGKPRRDGWIKVLCDEHHLERAAGLGQQ